MARALRIEYEGAFYHITSRGNDRKRIFYSKTDYSRFKSYLKEGAKKFGFILHSYVLMTNHYHLLIETPNANLSKIMHYINGSYTTYINRKRGRRGHLFQGRYKSILVDRDNYLLELSRYIHLNPVKAGIVERPQDYINSSYNSYINKKGEDIVCRDLIWSMISKKTKDAPSFYKSFAEDISIDELNNPLKDIYAGFVLGSKAFIKKALDTLDESRLKNTETSHRKTLSSNVEPENVLKAVSGHLNIPANDLLQMKGESRSITVYILKLHTEMTNNEIGSYFGGLSYSAVAKIKQRLENRLLSDRSLKKKVMKLGRYLSNVKG
ncbi:transposase [Thermodesulfobacteriota bacterium]